MHADFQPCAYIMASARHCTLYTGVTSHLIQHICQHRGGSFDGFYTQNGNRADETYLRRARLEISGVAYQDWGYVFNRNFGDSGADDNWNEMSVSYNGFDPVTLSVGRFNPTFGLEEATSSKWINNSS